MRTSPTDEVLIYGRNSCQALFQSRPHAIVRAYVRNDLVNQQGVMLKWLAQHKRAYHVVTGDELGKVCKSVHHDGLALLVKHPEALSIDAFSDACLKAERSGLILWCDGVENPHNLGAVIRSAAHFGVSGLLLTGTPMRSLPGAAYRVAMGGAEHVRLCFCDASAARAALRAAGYCLLATSAHEGTDLLRMTLPRKVAVIMGSESYGVRNDLLQGNDGLLTILGSGIVESLNLSVASALVMGIHRQQHVP